jgi:hypothetical protein
VQVCADFVRKFVRKFVQAAALRVKARIGQLLGDRKPGRPSDGNYHRIDNFHCQTVREFRILATGFGDTLAELPHPRRTEKLAELNRTPGEFR